MPYFYRAEKFTQARSSLMLPHAKGEAASIANAFHEAHLGLHNFDPEGLHEAVRGCILTTARVYEHRGR